MSIADFAMRIWNSLKNIFKGPCYSNLGKLKRVGIVDEKGDVHWFYPKSISIPSEACSECAAWLAYQPHEQWCTRRDVS
jgi:hypothetical protein